MAFPPISFLIVSVILWRMFNAAFVPDLLAGRLIEFLPDFLLDIGPLVRQLALVNFGLLYFGTYFVFAYYWERLRRTLRNPFYGALVLWMLNLLVIMPIAGKGFFGYKLPQGAFSASIFALASHWVFARSLQWRS